MNDRTDKTLSQALGDLAMVERAIPSSSQLEARVLAAWDAAHGRAARPARVVQSPTVLQTVARTTLAPRRLAAVRSWLPVAAALLLTTAAVLGPATRPSESPAETWRALEVERSAPATRQDWAVSSPAPEEGVFTTVRLQVPVEHLLQFGAEVSPLGAETAIVEVLVGEDGVARSARVVF